MGNIATYQVKILFKERTAERQWLNQCNIFETLCLLRSPESTNSYEVPFYIDDDRLEFQFGEKWSLFEGYDEEYRNKIKNRIWEADSNKLISKIYYRSSDGLDRIFSVANGIETKHRYCRYGFDSIEFKMKDENKPKQHEIETLNINGNTINLKGSYQTVNCRTRILGIKQIVEESYDNINEYYKTLTGLCSRNWDPPTKMYPIKYRDTFQLFFRACETVQFNWKNRKTLKMTNQSNQQYPDSFIVESDDYWDNVVDIEYFGDTSEESNQWNTNELNQEDEILSVTIDKK